MKENDLICILKSIENELSYYYALLPSESDFRNSLLFQISCNEMLLPNKSYKISSKPLIINNNNDNNNESEKKIIEKFKLIECKDIYNPLDYNAGYYNLK